LYEKYEATPYNTFLDPSDTTNIYSGMVMYRTGPDTVANAGTAVTTTGARAFGLSALDRNPNIDDVTQVGVNAWAVWLGGSNAFFTLTAPAFDTTQAYNVLTTGVRTLLYTNANGQVTSVSGTASTLGGSPVAELIDVISPTQIVVRLVPFGATN
jgi:hypothetical protein